MMKYYLEDEYNNCDCSEDRPTKEEIPKKYKEMRPARTTPDKQCCVSRCRKPKRPTAKIISDTIFSVDGRKCTRAQQTSFDSITYSETFPVTITPAPPLLSQPPTISRPIATTETLNGQFPCPCLSSDVRPFTGGDTFQTRYHMPVPQVQIVDQKKPPPTYISSAFIPYTSQYRTQQPTPAYDYTPEKLVKEEALDSQHKPQEYQPYNVAPASNEAKPLKRRSWIKTFNDAWKSMTQRKQSDEPGLCKCGENLTICGPNFKPCGGAPGVAVPCGIDCNCINNKECLNPYLYTLCPCEKPCKCPRELPTQMQSQEMPVEYSVAPQVLAVIPEYRPRHGSGASQRSERPDRTRKAQQLYQYHETDEDKPTLHAASDVTSDAYSYKKRKSVSDSEDCCCSCDDELCECCCCCCLDVSKKGIQTSKFCLRESYTQTDKAPKRCCRCCRCCTARGKKDCYKCLKGMHDMKPGIGEDGCGGQCAGGKNTSHWHYQNVTTNNHKKGSGGHNGTSGGHNGTSGGHNTISGGHTAQKDKHSHSAATNQTGPPRVHHSTKRISADPKRSTNSAPARGKTLMVRTNSIQCFMPTMENKGTSYACEDTLPTNPIDRFLSQFHGVHYEGQLTTSNYLQPLELSAEDITKLTQAKLRNYFLEGDSYLSPVSGRNYDLSYRGMSITSNVTSTKLLKPLDINEQLKYNPMETECFTSKVEHTKLMTAICEAILSSNQTASNNRVLEEPTKEVKQNFIPKLSDRTQPPSSLSTPPQFEILHTIAEDNESGNSVKIVDKVDNACSINPSIDSQSANQKLILEMQQNFKDEIGRLEEKVEKLLHGTSNTIESKPRVKTRSRSQSPSQLPVPSKQNKAKKDYKPLITKTGLFAVLPTRSQVLTDNSPRINEPIAVIDNQHGDAQSESIAKYDILVADNRKHVDELLGTLQVLHNHNTLSDKPKEITCFKKDTYAKNNVGMGEDTCCLKTAGGIPYTPDLGTGENIIVPKKQSSQTSSNQLFQQMENLFIGDTQDNQVFYLNAVCCNDPGPSNSASAKDANVTSKDCSQINQQPLADFSSIIFQKLPKVDDKKLQIVRVGEDTVPASSPNFILNNLQSFTTDISNSYTVQKMLRNEESALYSVSSSLFQENTSSDSSNFGDQNDKQQK